MSVCVSVCVPVCLCFCLCVCVHSNSKNNGSIHLKLEHIVVYENSLDEFNIIQIMPGPEGDLEEWQTQEVNVTRGERVTLTSWVCHSSRSPSGPGIICFVIPDSSTFSCTY